MTLLVDKDLNIINKENEIIAHLVFDNSKDLFYLEWEVSSLHKRKISLQDEQECLKIMKEWNCTGSNI